MSRETEKIAKQEMKKYGVQVTRHGITVQLTDEYASPKTLKHGILSRVLKRQPKES